MDTLQFVRGDISYQSIPLLLAAAVWGRAEEMGPGEAGAQRGLVTAKLPSQEGQSRAWAQVYTLWL